MTTGMRGAARGFTYVSLLLAVAMAGVGLALAGQYASTQIKRERERELLFAGEQFAKAIQSYRARSQQLSPGRSPLPASLEQLLEDPRGVRPVRHLRRLYVDPMTGGTDWGLMRDPNGGIVAVFSKSREAPMRVADLPEALVSTGPFRSYADWKFGVPFEPAPTVASAPQAPMAATSPLVTLDGSAVADAVQPTAPPPPAAAPLRRTDLRERDAEACERIGANDRRICAAMLQRFGKEAADACTQSAGERAAVCQDRDSFLPPLAVRQM